MISNLYYNQLDINDRLSILKLVKDSYANKIDSLVAHDFWNIIKNTPFLIDYLIINDNFSYFHLLGEHSLSNDNIAFLIIQQTKSIQYTPQSLLEKKSFIRNLLFNIPKSINIIPKQYWNTSEILDEFIVLYEKKEYWNIIPHDIINNKEFISYLLKIHPDHYEYLPNIIKNDINLFKISLNKDNSYHRYKVAGDNIINNKELSKKVILQSPKAYEYTHNNLKLDESFFLDLIKQKIDCLEFAHDTIKDNEICVWESIKFFPSSLQYASERLKNLPSYCIQISENMTLSHFHMTFPLWSNHVRENPEVIEKFLPSISINNDLQYIGKSFLNNMDFVLKVLSFNQDIMFYIGADIACNNEFFIKAYDIINMQQNKIGQYDIDSPQSQIFKAISDEASQDIYFLLDLYNHFSNQFIDIIYPLIKHFKNDTISYLNQEIANGNSLKNIMYGYTLDKRLNNKINSKNIEQKIHKNIKI